MIKRESAEMGCGERLRVLCKDSGKKEDCLGRDLTLCSSKETLARLVGSPGKD